MNRADEGVVSSHVLLYAVVQFSAYVVEKQIHAIPNTISHAIIAQGP